jgi:hypothetical protein
MLPPTAVVDDRRPVYAGKLKHFGQRCLRAQVFAVSREKGLQIGSVAMATEHSDASRAGLVCSTVVLVVLASRSVFATSLSIYSLDIDFTLFTPKRFL